MGKVATNIAESLVSLSYRVRNMQAVIRWVNASSKFWYIISAPSLFSLSPLKVDQAGECEKWPLSALPVRQVSTREQLSFLTGLTLLQNQEVFFFFFALQSARLVSLPLWSSKHLKIKWLYSESSQFPKPPWLENIKTKALFHWTTSSHLWGIFDREVMLSFGLGWAFPAF